MYTEEQIAAIIEENNTLHKEIAALSGKVAELMQALESYRRMLFGRKSEKHLALDPNQLDLFSPEGASGNEREESEKEARQAEEEMTKAIRPKERPARKPLDTSSLPVEEVNVYPDGTANEDDSLKDDYVEIGTEVTDRLERVPAKVYIVRVIRHKVMRKSDKAKDPEDRQILIAPLPPAPISKCIAGASVLADIIIGKFMYYLPFYRQIRMYREYGVGISDSTIGGWFEAAIERLKPLYDLLKRKILAGDYIQIDESVIPVLDDERHRAKKGYMWVVRDGVTGDVIFHYDLGRRSAKVARELLCSYHGIVQSDCYEAYNQFMAWDGIVLAGCLAHARRRYAEALDENRKLATQGLNFIAKLYRVEEEADAAGLSPDERRAKRQRKSKPVIEAFESWIMDPTEKVSAQSRIGKAIKYSYDVLPRLSVYLEDGRVHIDNNLIENTIRPLALGRKNYLFCGNDAAAYRAAIAYSLIGTCKAAGVDPRAWMEDVLKRIPYYERDGKDLAELLPRNWAEQVPDSAQKQQ